MSSLQNHLFKDLLLLFLTVCMGALMYRCKQVSLEARGFRFPGAGASWSFRQCLDSGARQEQGMFNH